MHILAFLVNIFFYHFYYTIFRQIFQFFLTAKLQKIYKKTVNFFTVEFLVLGRADKFSDAVLDARLCIENA